MPRPGSPGLVVVRLADRHGAAPATMNRRIAAARAPYSDSFTIPWTAPAAPNLSP